MAKITKTIATLLAMVTICLSAVTLLSGCSGGTAEGMTENTVEISDLQISYTSEADSPLGDIDDSTLVSSLNSASGTYFVVIDFGICGAEKNKSGLSLVTNFSVDDSSVLGLRLDSADTGSTVSSDSDVELTYSLPEKAGTVKTERIVFRLTPQTNGYAVLHLSFACEGKDIVGYFGDEWTVKVSDGKITTIEALIYKQYTNSSSGEYVVYVEGVNTESKAADLYIKPVYEGVNVTMIDDITYSMRGSISSIYIPATVTAIDNADMKGCFLKSITVDVNNPNYCSIDGSLYFYDYEDGCNELCLYKYAGDNGQTVFTMPDGVTDIYCDDADDFKNLTDIVFPDSMISIGDVFADCTNLQGTEGGLVYVGNWVVGISAIRSSYTIRTGTKGIAQWAFEKSNISEITIPGSVVAIGYEAFYCCKSLTTVVIGSGVKYIYMAFDGCTSLTSVTFENTSGWRGGYYNMFYSSLYEEVDVTDSAYNAQLVVDMSMSLVRD